LPNCFGHLLLLLYISLDHVSQKKWSAFVSRFFSVINFAQFLSILCLWLYSAKFS